MALESFCGIGAFAADLTRYLVLVSNMVFDSTQRPKGLLTDDAAPKVVFHGQMLFNITLQSTGKATALAYVFGVTCTRDLKRLLCGEEFEVVRM